ncbi:MAG: SdpI family protein [Vicingaceae bacterium]
MNIVNNFLFALLLIGSIFMLAGVVMIVFPPKKINSLYGYRTSASMKSQERWNFAQKYSAKEMIKLGGISILTSAIGFVYQPNENIITIISVGLALLIAVVLIVRVEKAIRKRFSD